jgi:homoserine O-acetyltransferase/O-succinyltransferase
MRRALFTFICLLFSVVLHAQDIPSLQFAYLGDLKLENGSVVHDCKIGYRTMGTLNATKSNAILFPTWFTGKSGDIVAGLGPGKYVDTSKYFVIAVDSLGNGVSTSPSNSAKQHGTEFPRFSIRDMVSSEYRLVTETLHLQHLHAVMGISMGGIQTFQWIASYPDFMDLAVPIVGTPQQSSYDLLLWNTELRALETDPEYKHGKYKQNPPLSTVALIHNMNLNTPDFRANHTTREGFQQYFNEIVTNGERFMDANDYLRQLQAIIGQDIAQGGSLYDAANKVKAKTLVINAAQDHMVNPLPPLGFAKLIHAQTLVLTSDCGHMAPGCEMDSAVKPAVQRFLDQH